MHHSIVFAVELKQTQLLTALPQVAQEQYLVLFHRHSIHNTCSSVTAVVVDAPINGQPYGSPIHPYPIEPPPCFSSQIVSFVFTTLSSNIYEQAGTNRGLSDISKFKEAKRLK